MLVLLLAILTAGGCGKASTPKASVPGSTTSGEMTAMCGDKVATHVGTPGADAFVIERDAVIITNGGVDELVLGSLGQSDGDEWSVGETTQRETLAIVDICRDAGPLAVTVTISATPIIGTLVSVSNETSDDSVAPPDICMARGPMFEIPGRGSWQPTPCKRR